MRGHGTNEPVQTSSQEGTDGGLPKVPVSALISPHILVLFIGTAYVAAVMIVNQGDPMAFVRVGSSLDPLLGSTQIGYDGQFAFQIANDPLGAYEHLDVPAYRYQRILYPLMASVLSFGNERLIPYVLIAINLIALTAGTWITGRLLHHNNLNPWYGLVFALNVGMLMALRLDLNEPLAFLLVQVSLLYWFREEFMASAVALALAALTKEVTLILGAGLGLSLLLRGDRRRAVVWGTIAAAPYLTYITFLRLALGSWAPQSGGALATSFQWLPYRGWWGLAQFGLDQFLLISALIVPLAILPSLIGIYLAGQSIVGGQRDGPAHHLG